MKVKITKNMSQVAHQAKVYPGFCSMNCLGVFPLFPPPWDNESIPGQLLPGQVQKGTVRIECFTEEHIT